MIKHDIKQSCEYKTKCRQSRWQFTVNLERRLKVTPLAISVKVIA